MQSTATLAPVPTAQRRFPSLALCVLIALLFAGYIPLLIRFAGEQWAKSQYQFFPLMLISALAIGWQRLRDNPVSLNRSPQGRHGTVLLCVSLAIFAAACLLWSGRMAATSALLSMIGLAWRIGGRNTVRLLTPSFLLLALVIGPPVGSDEVLLQRLRELAVAISGGVLVLLGIPHLSTGTIIEIAGSRLLVAEACSGINSLMAVLGCTMVIGFIRRRSPRVLLMLLVCGVLFVLWANVVRIAGGVWLKTAHDIDILSGEAHEVASLVLFSICILMVLCTDEAAGLLRWLLKEDIMPAPPSADDAAVQPASAPHRRLGILVWLLAFAFAAVGATSVAYAHTHGGLARWLDEPGTVHLKSGAAFTVPSQLGNWTRSEDAEKLIAQPEIEGKRSQVWAYRAAGVTALVAIDYPFLGYHDLTLCYRNGGWTIAEQTYKSDSGAPLAGHYTGIDLVRLNERGLVWYSALNEQGTWAEPPATSTAGRLYRRLQHIGRPDWNGATYQVQLFVQAYEPFTDEQRKALEELFLLARRELGSQVLSQLEGAPQ